MTGILNHALSLVKKKSAAKSTVIKSSIGVDDVVATSMNSLCIDEEPGMALMSVHSISMAAPWLCSALRCNASQRRLLPGICVCDQSITGKISLAFYSHFFIRIITCTRE